MILTILSHALAALAGGGAVFLYLHKNQAAAIAAANSLSASINSAKSTLQGGGGTLADLSAAANVAKNIGSTAAAITQTDKGP